MRKSIVICGFPGIGKTCAASNRSNILDAESSAFSWIWNVDIPEKGRERNPDFPGNYIKYIKENMEKYDVILASSHQAVREALKAEGVQFVIVAPLPTLQNEYMIRYLERGSSVDFIEQLYENWATFINDLCNDGAPIIWLEKGMYLTDVLGVMAK